MPDKKTQGREAEPAKKDFRDFSLFPPICQGDPQGEKSKTDLAVGWAGGSKEHLLALPAAATRWVALQIPKHKAWRMADRNTLKGRWQDVTVKVSGLKQ